MRNKSEIIRRLEKLEAISNTPSDQERRKWLDQIERMVAEAGEYAERPENKALAAELYRQRGEYIRETREQPREKDHYRAEMNFWLWRVEKGYLSPENLAKLAGHENFTSREFNELVGKRNAVFPDAPYPEFPEYAGTVEHEFDYDFAFLPSPATAKNSLVAGRTPV